MFVGASNFNGDLSSWDVSQVTTMTSMFNGASSFNGDLSSWDVSSVTKMDRMFDGASSFNGDLSSWDVSKVTVSKRTDAEVCSIHGLSDLYSQTLPSGESCPKGCQCCKADGSC